MQLQPPKHLLLLAAALTASGAGRAAAQGTLFDIVPTNCNCDARTVSVAASGEAECAIRSINDVTSRSFTFINEVCVLSDSPYCVASSAAKVFRKLVNVWHPGYEQQIGSRRFWVFQQRQTGLVAFNRCWAEYENGFGNGTDGIDTEFWSGLVAINEFTKSRNNTMRIEMTTVDGHFYAAEWPNFVVADASTNYRMTCGAMIVGSSNTTSGDPMAAHNGMKFSTFDRDNDLFSTSCSSAHGQGGFWYKDCLTINPNGLYPPGSSVSTNVTYIFSVSVESSKPLRAIRMMLQV